jgi:MerR family transcriptional regulator/heat shock protein HspR
MAREQSVPFDGARRHREAAVYVISVAAELTGLHPQTLRQYDRLGLVSPGRSTGRGRRYSDRDIELLREIARLSAEGISLNGIKRILELEAHIDALQRQVVELQGMTRSAPAGTEPRTTSARDGGARRDAGTGRAARPTGSSTRSGREVVPLRTPTALVVWSRNRPR